jgi:hypothetical protein
MLNDRLHSARRRTALGAVVLAILLPFSWPLGVKAQSEPAAQVKRLATSAAKAVSTGSGKTANPSPSKGRGREERRGLSVEERTEPSSSDDEAASEDRDLTPVGGRRDPFRLPAPPVLAGKSAGKEPTSPLPPGVRGLVIGQLRLEGTVRQEATNTMIAVVTNATNRAYFLHENDAVFNGVVTRISPDAIYFKENTLDANGRLATREVVRRLGQAAGEER